MRTDVFQVGGLTEDGIWIDYAAVVQFQAGKRAAKVVI